MGGKYDDGLVKKIVLWFGKGLVSNDFAECLFGRVGGGS